MNREVQDNLSSFLKKLSIIRDKYIDLAKREDQFNIFSVLHQKNDERRLHSRFISSILCPYGSHNQNCTFLDMFLKNIGCDLILHPEDIEVYPNEYDKSEHHNIDILIIDRKSRKAIIIENKIYANDSNSEDSGQLERYFNYVHTKEKIPIKDIWVYYLSLDGHEPSEESLGNSKSNVRKRYFCISYKSHILQWLDECLMHTVAYPFLRESLLQYIALIKSMTNETSIEERLEIRDLIAKSEDNMMSAKLLVENFNHVKWHTVRDFWDELSFQIKALGYDVSETAKDENITFITHFDVYKKGFKNAFMSMIFSPVPDVELYVWSEYDSYIYWGCSNDGRTSKEYQQKLTDFQHSNKGYETSEESIFWKYFDLPEDKQIYFHDFSGLGTYRLIRPKYREQIIQSMVKEISQFVAKLKKI